jgi:hypothetical protein
VPSSTSGRGNSYFAQRFHRFLLQCGMSLKKAALCFFRWYGTGSDFSVARADTLQLWSGGVVPGQQYSLDLCEGHCFDYAYGQGDILAELGPVVSAALGELAHRARRSAGFPENGTIFHDPLCALCGCAKNASLGEEFPLTVENICLAKSPPQTAARRLGEPPNAPPSRMRQTLAQPPPLDRRAQSR